MVCFSVWHLDQVTTERKSHFNTGGLGETLFSGVVTVEIPMEINGDDPVSNPIYWNQLF